MVLPITITAWCPKGLHPIKVRHLLTPNMLVSGMYSEAKTPQAKTPHDFSAREDEFIRKYSGKITYSALAKKMGRSTGSINGRAYRLGLCGKRKLLKENVHEISRQ